MDKKFTKIVATVSDLRCDVDFIKQLYEAGMNVVRMNTAHTTEEGLQNIIKNVRTVSDQIALLIDTKGPEIRTTKTEESIELKAGDRIKVAGDPDKESSRDFLYTSYKPLAEELSVGKHILIDDGEIDLLVIDRQDGYLYCEAQNNGIIGSRKSVNIPDVRINLDSVTEKDHQNILRAIDNKLDFIAHSFVRNKEDVLAIQKILDEHKSDIKIIAKIENQEGVDNIDEILEVAYGIMIARGDLGIEVPQEKIPGIQMALIKKSIEHKKPVIVATQMLHTMIKNPRPTRAEITDVANAIFYRTSAVMLSGETAYGKYPVEAVRTMATIAREAESVNFNDKGFKVAYNGKEPSVTAYMARGAARSAIDLGVKAIITDSHTGKTARILASCRGKVPVYAMCTSHKIARRLALSYGVWPEYFPNTESINDTEARRKYYVKVLTRLMNEGLIEASDLVAYLGGSFGQEGGTTYLDIAQVDRILEAGERYSLPDYTA